MLSKIVIIITCIISFNVAHAQHIWYENETNTNNIESTSNTFTTNQSNPNTSGENSNRIVSKFTRKAETTRDFTYFKLFNPIVSATAYQISLKAYIDLSTLINAPNRLRVYLKNTANGEVFYKQLNFREGQKWQNFTFNINANEFTQAGLANGGYDQMYIGYGNGHFFEDEIIYYIDSIYGTTKQTNTNTNTQILAGSWGVTFPVFGGERLDAEVNNEYNHREGAKEIVTELPATGHIFSNLSYFAHSHYFTLRENPNVDIPNEIHESLVPSLENEKIILDVLQTFKANGKKIILYISTNYMDRASDETKTAWSAYYNRKFAGNEYLAYENLIQGFIERFKDYADGYWLDTTNRLSDDSKLDDFINMIKTTDPGAQVTANLNKNYFRDANGTFIQVDTDGLDETVGDTGNTNSDEIDYKVILHEPLNEFQDFTNGHVTPLGQGAPANSWGYDEFTIPNMVNNPTVFYNGKLVLKHAWFPMRERWHSPRVDMSFELEQAYRFVKSVTDAGASITFANTTDYGKWNAGYMMKDEMDIMKEINDRLLMTNVPGFEPYKRPPGAFLVGEDITLGVDKNNSSEKKLSINPNPANHSFKISKEITSASVYNIKGQKVLEFLENENSYDVSKLSAGLYLLKVYYNLGESQIIRFIKE